MLELRGLGKKFGSKSILKNLNLKVPPGQICVLLGPNGAGKSTLLRILCTISRPSKGDALVGKRSIVEEPVDVRKSIGVVLHEMMLYEDLTAAENLYFFAHLHGLKDVHRRVDEMLKRVNLFHRRDDRVGEFSRGMKQRVSVARALIGDPKVLLLDEPFTGLDVKSKDQVSAMLSKAASNGVTIMMTGHDAETAHDLAHRLLVLIDGRLQYDELRTSVSKSEFVQKYRELVGAVK